MQRAKIISTELYKSKSRQRKTENAISESMKYAESKKRLKKINLIKEKSKKLLSCM